MKNCKICYSKADKTGSHIVPHFLLKRIDTEIGKNGRDKELGFMISEKNSSGYFGRGTSTEKLTEIFGNIDDQRIADNKHPLVEDNIFCSRCEKELAASESIYSTSIIQTFFKSDENYTSKIKSNNALLFWISVIFRLSISENSGVKLLPEHEELLRVILCDFFTNQLINDDIKKIKYKLFRAYDYSSKYPTVLHFNPEKTNPYLANIDEYIIIFAIDCEPSTNGFYSVKLPTENAIENNTDVIYESLYSIDYKIMTDVNKAFFDKAASQYNKKLFEDCDLLYQKVGRGKVMPIKMKEEILKSLNEDKSISFGDKYSLNHKFKIISEIIQKNVI